jgi:16S rRNA (uracil1498-N3)-methyltransferase
MPVFFSNRITGRLAELDKDESRHIIKVLRLKAGDTLELVDGLGNFYRGIIQNPDPERTRVSIRETVKDYLARACHLHLAIAPTKSTDRFEWFLEKATEIGVDEISPLICARSERNRIRQDRSEKILLAAMKQSGRAFLPVLHQPVSLPDLLESARADFKFIAHCGNGTRRPLYRPEPRIPETPDQVTVETYPGNTRGGVSAQRKPTWLVLIGPEGDFTPDEVDMARERGYESVSLGEAVFRTETAGIVACTMVNLLART